MQTSNTIVGVDFGAPKRARDQRRKIIAIAAHPIDWRKYRIDATDFNERLLADDPPGWTARELLDQLLNQPVRIVAFDFPFCIPDTLLRDEKFAADVGHEDGAFIMRIAVQLDDGCLAVDRIRQVPACPGVGHAKLSSLPSFIADDGAQGILQFPLNEVALDLNRDHQT